MKERTDTERLDHVLVYGLPYHTDSSAGVIWSYDGTELFATKSGFTSCRAAIDAAMDAEEAK